MPTFMPKPKSMCPGASCPGCSSSECYAEGGNVNSQKNRKENERGVHQSAGKFAFSSKSDKSQEGQSLAGSAARKEHTWANQEHRRVLNEQRGMKKPNLYAEGGDVYDKTHRRDNEKGINKASIRSPGTSEAGAALHPAFSVHEDIDKDVAKRRHHKVLGEMRAMKKPKLYAQGGEVSQQDKVDVLRAQDKDPEFMKAQAEKLGLTKYEAKGGEIDSDGDGELHHAIGSELLDALEKKDKKGIMSALTAAIMQCMGDES